MYKRNKKFLAFLIFVSLLLNKGITGVNIYGNNLNWIQQTGFNTERGEQSERQKHALTAYLLGFKLSSGIVGLMFYNNTV